jgi:hypothetical protein
MNLRVTLDLVNFLTSSFAIRLSEGYTIRNYFDRIKQVFPSVVFLERHICCNPAPAVIFRESCNTHGYVERILIFVLCITIFFRNISM